MANTKERITLLRVNVRVWRLVVLLSHYLLLILMLTKILFTLDKVKSILVCLKVHYSLKKMNTSTAPQTTPALTASSIQVGE